MATSNGANNQTYDVFISYSRADYKDASKNVIAGSVISKIKERFQRANISYWIDEDGISAGDAFAELISDKIDNSAIFLFVATPNSIKSQWTKKEIKLAHDKQKHIIPFKCGDFSYPKGMDLLLSDLDEINDYNVNPESALDKLVRSVMDVFPDRMQLSAGSDNLEIKKELVNLEKRVDALRKAMDELSRKQDQSTEIGLITREIVKQVLDAIEKRIYMPPVKEAVVAAPEKKPTTGIPYRINLLLMFGYFGDRSKVHTFNTLMRKVLYKLKNLSVIHGIDLQVGYIYKRCYCHSLPNASKQCYMG